jgi:CheY-like chemotaxis protein
MVIITDLDMPEMNGFELTKKIRKMQENKEINLIPILAHSAAIDEKTKNKINNCEFDGFVEKPCNVNRFSILIKQIYNIA